MTYGNENDDNNSSYPARSANDPVTGHGARPRHSALEVTVEQNIEKAIKVLKRKLIKEGIFRELKQRRYFEKPSEKKKRKSKESVKKIRKEESRAKKNPYLFS
jgi:small subunit ribosomal protein S21